MKYITSIYRLSISDVFPNMTNTRLYININNDKIDMDLISIYK